MQKLARSHKETVQNTYICHYLCESIKNVDYVMVDIYCWLKVFFKNDRGSFFDNISDLQNLVVKENAE